MCRQRGGKHCGVAGELYEVWRVYKLYGGVAGNEAPKLGMVQVMEHGSLRSHECILHFENYGELQININPGNIVIIFVLKTITSEAVWMMEEEGRRASYFIIPSRIND